MTNIEHRDGGRRERDLLEWADGLDGDVATVGMDWKAAYGRFDHLAAERGREFGVEDWCDPDVQRRRRRSLEDSSTLDHLVIPASSASSQHDVSVRVSTFFPLATYYAINWIEGVPEGSEGLAHSVQNRIDRVLSGHGYEVIKRREILFSQYYGRREVREEGCTWFRWFFSYHSSPPQVCWRGGKSIGVDENDSLEEAVEAYAIDDHWPGPIAVVGSTISYGTSIPAIWAAASL